MYCEMDEQERKDGRYHLVFGTEFKLGLQDPKRLRADGLPAGMSPEDAFSEFLRLMKLYIMRRLQHAARGAVGVGSAAAASAAVAATARGMIRWCLTVPAMWSDGAKGAVRRAAHRAGLITALDSDELTVVLEPEAAALQVSLGADRTGLYPAVPAAAAAAAAAPTTSGVLLPGELFMVVDAGGGTVDITIHEVESRGGTAVLSEVPAVPGCGEMWGATAVDSEFQRHFRSRVGEEVYDTWLRGHLGEWNYLMEEHWEPIKCGFDSGEEPGGGGTAGAGPAPAGPDDDDDDEWQGGGGGAAAGGGGSGGRRRGTTWRVPIPPTLHALMDGGVKADMLIEDGLDDSVVLDRRTLAHLFHGPVHGVIHAAQQQLDTLAAAPQARAARCAKVMLVGGFGCSRYLQSQLAAAMGGRVMPGGGVVVPERPAAVVLKGAVLYGLNPELVRARTSRLTYGVRTAVPYEEGMPAKFWHPAEVCYYSAAGFSTFVRQGQLVEAEEVVTHVFTPLSPDQQIASVELWASDKKDVRWLDEELVGVGEGAVEAVGAEAANGDAGGGGGGDGGSRAGGGGGGGRGSRSMYKVCDVEVILLRDEPVATPTMTSTSGPSTSSAPVPHQVPGSAAAVRGGGGVGGELEPVYPDQEREEEGEEEERLIEVSLQFGRTEIRVAARDMATGRRYTRRVKFAFY